MMPYESLLPFFAHTAGWYPTLQHGSFAAPCSPPCSPCPAAPSGHCSAIGVLPTSRTTSLLSSTSESVTPASVGCGLVMPLPITRLVVLSPANESTALARTLL